MALVDASGAVLKRYVYATSPSVPDYVGGDPVNAIDPTALAIQGNPAMDSARSGGLLGWLGFEQFARGAFNYDEGMLQLSNDPTFNEGIAQFLTEEAPLLEGAAFSETRDMIEVDMLAQSFFWKRPETETTILRPAHIVGFVRNVPSHDLRPPVIPALMGFDPMAQIAHQDDVCWRLGHFASFPRGLRWFFPPEHFFVIVLEASGHTR